MRPRFIHMRTNDREGLAPFNATHRANSSMLKFQYSSSEGLRRRCLCE